MNHRCSGKQRIDDLRSKTGQAAYAFYCTWMRLQRHTVPPIETFSESNLFSTFMKFAKHVESTRLPEPDAFIKMMVENGKVPPSLWCRDTVFSMYLKLYDVAVPPRTQFMRSIDVLDGMAIDLGVALRDVFQAMGLETIIDLIERRKLSPWLLMASSVFKSYLMQLPEPDRDLLARVINVGAFVERSRNEAALLKEFSEGTKVIGL